MTLIAEAQQTDWPSIIAAIFAGLFGLVNLIYTLKAKDQAKAAAKSVQESRQERSEQIDKVVDVVGRAAATVTAKVEEGINVSKEGIVASNNYNVKIADAVEGTRQLREDFQSQPKQP
ncbi:MAG: hypothetical protein JWM59_1556 [Verrucomicrobiales bacterium]|nr:hypothetical protein [Verrucomicrobiales bacterium]